MLKQLFDMCRHTDELHVLPAFAVPVQEQLHQPMPIADIPAYQHVNLPELYRPEVLHLQREFMPHLHQLESAVRRNLLLGLSHRHEGRRKRLCSLPHWLQDLPHWLGLYCVFLWFPHPGRFLRDSVLISVCKLQCHQLRVVLPGGVLQQLQPM